ncbi:MAG: beta-N-acetylhexosaminidase [Armatimonadota bacterium]|nr:beta-N-acetylhexosaminidase [Armatimonadota bacterium]
MKLSVKLQTAPAELRDGLAAIVLDFPDRFGTGAPMTFTADSTLHGPRVSRTEAGVHINYGRRIDAYRALGRLLGADDLDAVSFEETCRFDTLGVMIDCSRNGVLTVATAKDFLRRCALMGINMMHLYTEDTYEVPGEPFFGYMRGRYTYDELKEIDDYAYALGIEMIPCIQTLGHLDQIFQWPAYRELQDDDGVLLTADERTYALLEKMISAASAPFRSRRINIGMDESFGLGRGRHWKAHGDVSQLEMLNDHIRRMRDICAARGLRPMIWGDMYFCFASPSIEYYDSKTVFPEGFAERIPKDVDLVYWDYYHGDVEFYEEWIDRYRELGCEPLFSCSAWTHVRLWAALQWSFKTVSAGMTAARGKGVREAMISLWGDDGTEADYYSALPAMQLFAEFGYADEVDMEQVKRNFRGSCGAEMDGFVEASKIDYFAFRTDGTESFSNHSKWLLYQDLMLGLMDPQLEDFDLRAYYSELAGELESAAERGGLAERLRYPAAIARALSLKTHLRRDLRAAYLAGDKARLRELAEGDLASLRKSVDALWKCYRDMWLATFKPFGLEVIEQRYGGLLARLETALYRVNSYLNGEIAEIPELEQEPLRFLPQPVEHVWVPYRRVTTPSFIK